MVHIAIITHLADNKSMHIDIKDIPFFKGLTMPELAALRTCLVEKSFRKGDVLHHEGSECTSLFFVKDGRVKVFRNSTEGREQIYEVLGPGDTCACNPGELSWKCGSSAQALSESIVWFLSRSSYVNMLRSNPTLMHSLNDLFAKR